MGRKRVSGDCKRTAPVECSAPLYSPTECRLRRFDTWGLFTQRKASHPKIVSHVCLHPTESWLRRELAPAIAARAECAARRRQLSQNVGYRVHRLQNVSPAGIAGIHYYRLGSFFHFLLLALTHICDWRLPPGCASWWDRSQRPPFASLLISAACSAAPARRPS